MWDYYIDILKGVPKDHWGNVFIMQSDENLQKVLFTARGYLKYGNNREDAIELALQMHSLNLKLDFTDLDIAKIEKWVRGYLD